MASAIVENFTSSGTFIIFETSAAPETPSKSPYKSAYEAQNYGLREELEQYRGRFGSESLSYAYFARSLRYGDEHNIHNAYSADYERYCADRRYEYGKYVYDRI